MITINHAIDFTNSTVTITIKDTEDKVWDVREFGFDDWKNMTLWVSTIESTINLCNKKYDEMICYKD
jgi:hypothetical protein